MKKILSALLLITASSVSYSEAPTKQASAVSKDIVVYRSPSCGCCGKWLGHLKENGFNIIDKVTENMDAIKQHYGVKPNLASCHTAIINGKIIEGHVPVKDINKLLSTQNNIKGLAVPGMVVGTPGMEMGNKKMPFKVIAFDAKDKTTVYQNYEQY